MAEVNEAGQGDQDGQEQGLEERLGRLEAIVERLERDDLELEEALALFEEGIAHVRAAHDVLETGKLRVEKLVTELNGEISLEPESDDG